MKHATVRYCLLPDNGDGKTGLDDFLAEHDVDELRTLVVDELPAEQPVLAQAAEPLPAAEPHTIAEVVATFQRWQYMPDTTPLLAALGAVAANRLTGDPIWVLLVGPPGCGKSEIIQSFGRLDYVHAASSLTEPALLSGVAKRDHTVDASGGLLRDIGDFGIVALKDFTSILAMHREPRGQLLAALREVYDGSWTRRLGTDGGKTLHWSGKVGLIGGVTPTVDRHHQVMSSMGERFVMIRFPDVDPAELARASLRHAGHYEQMRTELAEAVRGLFARPLPAPRPLHPAEIERLVALATLAVRGRSAVERDYQGEVELVPAPEVPTRLVAQLERLLVALGTLGVDATDAWQVIQGCAFDSIPQLRRKILELLVTTGEKLNTTAIGEKVAHPHKTTRRALEDLQVHGLVTMHAGGEGKAHLWEAAEWTQKLWQTATTWPEVSPEPNTGVENQSEPPQNGDSTNASYIPLRVQDDFSGQVPEYGDDWQSEIF
jgi:hypothetical protein